MKNRAHAKNFTRVELKNQIKVRKPGRGRRVKLRSRHVVYAKSEESTVGKESSPESRRREDSLIREKSEAGPWGVGV